MKTAYLAFGSNLDNPVLQIHEAIDRIKAIPGVNLKKLSSLYQSIPMGPKDQPDYVNAVAAIETNLTAEELLRFLQRIETAQGRVRTETRWGPRIIDIDILLFGDDVIETSVLTIPHKGLKKREFVIYPLAEIAPRLVLPTGERVVDLRSNCPRRQLRRMAVKASETKA